MPFWAIEPTISRELTHCRPLCIFHARSYDSDSDEGSSAAAAVEALPPVHKKPQVIFCSRTHSQLSQFVGELHRTSFADTLSLVALGSRKALCVNDAVTALQSLSAINEKCMDMQRKKPSTAARARVDGASAGAANGAASGAVRRVKKKATGRCAYLAASDEDYRNFTDAVLASPMDIEVRGGRCCSWRSH